MEIWSTDNPKRVGTKNISINIGSSNGSNITREKRSRDSECENFREMMRGWPQEKPKAAIIVLTHPSKLKRMKRMMKNLDLFFLKTFRYPIIIFHEKIYRTYIKDISEFTNTSTYFQEVSFSILDFIKKDAIPRIYCKKTIGEHRLHVIRYRLTGKMYSWHDGF